MTGGARRVGGASQPDPRRRGIGNLVVLGHHQDNIAYGQPERTMARLRARRTSFVIAHRLSTILDADLIASMEIGDLLGQGSHAVLMLAKGARPNTVQ